MRCRALLGSDLNNAFIAARDIDHPAAFLHEQGERLLDVDIFAGAAGHHTHERMPMIGRGDHDCIDAFVIQQAAEIAMQLRTRSNELAGRLQTRLISVSDGDNL